MNTEVNKQQVGRVIIEKESQQSRSEIKVVWKLGGGGGVMGKKLGEAKGSRDTK